MSGGLVGDRYRLVERIGVGGMGYVWRAHDDVLHRTVAVKEVNLPDGLSDEDLTDLRLRTLREARTAARLNHPNVVRVYDVIYADERPWIVMEHVESRSLAQVVKETGPMSPDLVARIGLALVSALEAAHQAGVLHRDIKPGNVLLADDGRIMLTDFGLATFDDLALPLTQTGVVYGSPQFIAPERAHDGTSSPEADMWSLGATLYAAVEGRAPYARSSSYATLAALATSSPDPSRLAGSLKPVLDGLLTRNPRHRMEPDEVRSRLERIITADPRTSRLIPRPRRREGSGKENSGSFRDSRPRGPQDDDAPSNDSQTTSTHAAGTQALGTQMLSVPVATADGAPISEVGQPADETVRTSMSGISADADTDTESTSPSGSGPTFRAIPDPGALPRRRPAASMTQVDASPERTMSPIRTTGGWPDALLARSASGDDDITGLPPRNGPRRRSHSQGWRIARRSTTRWAPATFVAVLVLLLVAAMFHYEMTRSRSVSSSTPGGAPGAGPSPGSTPTNGGPPSQGSPPPSPPAGPLSPVQGLVGGPGGQPPPGGQPAIGAVAWLCVPTLLSGAGPMPTSHPISSSHWEPKGWVWYQDGTGFRIALPSRWNLVPGDRNACFYDPTLGRLVGVNQWDAKTTNPVAALDDRDTAIQNVVHLPMYHRIKISPVKCATRCADWEYTYQGPFSVLHVIVHMFLDKHGYAYAITWSTPDSTFAANKSTYQRIIASFTT